MDENRFPELTEQIARIRKARRGKLIPVYGLLLHSPAIADAWMALLNVARWETDVQPRWRELAILRVACLNRAQYVIDVHRANFTESEGLTHAECEAVLQREVVPGVLPANEEALLRYIDAMTLSVQVPAETFQGIRAFLSERQILELSVLVGIYNMHTRVICALEIDRELPDTPAGAQP